MSARKRTASPTTVLLVAGWQGKSPEVCLDCNPAILVGKKPGRLAGRDLLVGGAEPQPAKGTIAPVGEFQPHIVDGVISTSCLKKEKKELGVPFWLAILAEIGRTGSASSSWWGRSRGWAGASGGGGCCSHTAPSRLVSPVPPLRVNATNHRPTFPPSVGRSFLWGGAIAPSLCSSCSRCDAPDPLVLSHVVVDDKLPGLRRTPRMTDSR